MNKPLNIAALFPPRPTPQFPTSYDPTFDGVPYNLEVNCEPVIAWFTHESDDSGRKPWYELQKVDYKGVDVIGLLTDEQVYDLHWQMEQQMLRDKEQARVDEWERQR